MGEENIYISIRRFLIGENDKILLTSMKSNSSNKLNVKTQHNGDCLPAASGLDVSNHCREEF